jgi:hypothetical protein
MSIVSHDVFAPLTDGQRLALVEAWPNGARLEWAWRIARDLETCRALLAGQPVDAERLDQAELFSARRARLVQLVAPADLLEGVADVRPWSTRTPA